MISKLKINRTRIPSIVFTKASLKDFELLDQTCPNAHDYFMQVVELFEQNPDMLDDLLKNGVFYGDPSFDWQGVVSWRKAGYDIVRLKIRETNVDYRMFLGYNVDENKFHVLSVAERNINYNLKHPKSIETLKAYDDANIKRITRH
jgi:hypothetical protein